jgi:glycerophosphoryl diester phosphodiesterase
MSRAAYQQAITEGADGFECDLRLSKDGQLMLWHDPDLMRVAGEPGRIAKLTARQIQVLSHCLTFDQFIALALSAKVDLLLETKHPVPGGGKVERELIRTLNRWQPEIANSGIEIFPMSFSFWAVWRLRKFESVQLIERRATFHFASLNGAKIIGIGLHVLRAHPDLVAKAHRKGRKVFVWTVNEEADIKFVRALGVDAIITDRPGFARQVA